MKKAKYKEYTEVLVILNNMEPKYKKKIPKKLINFFEKNKDKDYNFKIDSLVPLNKQKISSKTLAILAMINLNYWCETEGEKRRLIEIYAQNDQKVKEENKKKNNLAYVLNKEIKNESALIEKKENFFVKVWNKIKKILVSN